MLNIQIENIGKVKNANIVLEGISVIAGLNGTGKSTIAKSVFASVNARRNMLDKIRSDRKLSIDDQIIRWMDQNNNLSDYYYMDMTQELATHILESFEKEKWNKKDVSKIVKTIIEEYCKNNRLSDHGIEEVVGHIVTVLDRTMDEYVNFFVEQYYQNVFKSQINPIGTKEKSSVHYKKTEGERKIESSVEIENNKLNIMGRPLIFQQENAIYIETYSVLDFCEETGRRTRRGSYLNRMTLPARELLSSLTEERVLSYDEQQKVELNEKIAQNIVEQVTHGYLRKNQSGSLEFLDKDAEEKIEFSNMSAGLKIFTVLQQLIGNYSLKEGDVLIVDEPEVNLHPTWQVVLAEILVRVYKELGIYILVNSHSPYFIRAIEVKMAEYECALQGHYYYMDQKDNGFVSKEVSDNTNVIYDTLYRPLKEL